MDPSHRRQYLAVQQQAIQNAYRNTSTDQSSIVCPQTIIVAGQGMTREQAISKEQQAAMMMYKHCPQPGAAMMTTGGEVQGMQPSHPISLDHYNSMMKQQQQLFAAQEKHRLLQIQGALTNSNNTHPKQHIPGHLI